MPSLDLERLQAHRARTFNLPPFHKLSAPSQALEFVNARGFTYFWPIKGVDFPSLWTAVAGDRPVADAHDDHAENQSSDNVYDLARGVGGSVVTGGVVRIRDVDRRDAERKKHADGCENDKTRSCELIDEPHHGSDSPPSCHTVGTAQPKRWVPWASVARNERTFPVQSRHG